ncbi:MAG: hypothetical protein RQ756_01830 [Flavobacteriaceae bacterium]|nr:hypothetical protein [Flavobacteriaceae bacterium]
MATLKQLMTLLNKLGINNDLRREMIHNFTHGRTSSARELSNKELNLMCTKLKSELNVLESDLLVRRKRSVILAIATRVGIKEVNHWAKFNRWMLKSSILHKELHAYNLEELELLMKQFRAIEANYEKSAKKAGTKAWHHFTGIPEIASN